MAFADSDTGASYTSVFVQVDDVNLQLATGAAAILPSVYIDGAAAQAGHKAIHNFPWLTLTPAEISTPSVAFTQALQAAIAAGKVSSPRDALIVCTEILLMGRPEFAGATLV